MANRMQRAARTIGALVPTVFAACSQSPNPPERPLPRADVEGLQVAGAQGTLAMSVPSNWLGYRLGLTPPTLVEVAGRKVQRAPADWRARMPVAVSPSPGATPSLSPQASKLMRVDKAGKTYQMVVPDQDLETVDQFLRSSGKTGGWRPPQQSESVVQKGWVGGRDSRVRWDYASGDWPRDTMGALESYTQATCSGTLFGRRLVLTAAHCITSVDGSFYMPDAFVPGMDGTSGETPDVWPYGAPGIETFTYFSGWTDNNCTLENAQSLACQKYDIAFLVLNQDVGDSTGWMGWYWASSDATVAGWVPTLTFGYPNCNYPDAPAGCIGSTLWGDWANCPITGFYNPGSNGTNENFLFGCDTSEGDSGSALWSFAPNGCGSVPCITGVVIDQNCDGSGCASPPNNTPNIARRIDQGTSGTMAYLQSLYP